MRATTGGGGPRPRKRKVRYSASGQPVVVTRTRQVRPVLPKPQTGGVGDVGSTSYNQARRQFWKRRRQLGPVLSPLGKAVAGTSKGLYSSVTGFPTGVYMTGRGVGHDVIRAGHGDLSFKRSRAIGSAVGSSFYNDIRHPGGEPGQHDYSGLLLDISALFSAGGGTAARGAAAMRVARRLMERHPGVKPSDIIRAAAAKPQYTRRLKGPGKLEVPASPNPLFRGGAKVGQKIQPKRTAIDISKKELVTRKRVAKQRLGYEPLKRSEHNLGFYGKVAGLPMNALRALMLVRPRYFLQNFFQTGSATAVRPISTINSARMLRKIAKERPGLYNELARTAGDPQALSVSAEMAGPGSTALEKYMHSRVFRKANAPERFMRSASLLTALRDQMKARAIAGERTHASFHPTPEDISNFLLGVERQGVFHPVHQAIKRGVSEVGDFNRVFGKELHPDRFMTERDFMKTQIPIFYPMFKALTRYGARFPSEHSIISALGYNLGAKGKEEQKRLLGDLPFWAQYLIPTHAGDPHARPGSANSVINPANLYNMQPAADIGRQTAEMIRKGGPRPGISLLQEVGPLPDIVYGALRGQDLATGYPLPGVREHGGLGAALLNYLGGLPGQDIGRALVGAPQRVRSYEAGNLRQRLLGELIGPGFIPRNLKRKETEKQAKKETSFGKKHRKKRRKGNKNRGGDSF